MRFNTKREQEISSSSSVTNNTTDGTNSLFDVIDVLILDSHSRLTFTKKIKKIFPLKPDDKIIVYQNKYNKNIILKVQNEGNMGDSWILTKNKEGIYKASTVKDSNSSTTNTNINNTSSVGSNSSYNKSKLNTQIGLNIDKKKENQSTFNIIYKENTLYSTPIILVDDDPDSLEIYESFLKYEGYKNIKTFFHSKNVLVELSDIINMHYKLAILDIRMPDINGIQLYQILKILNPSIKILFLTALDAVSELTSILPGIKPTDIILKPPNVDQFIEKVNDTISSCSNILV